MDKPRLYLMDIPMQIEAILSVRKGQRKRIPKGRYLTMKEGSARRLYRPRLPKWQSTQGHEVSKIETERWPKFFITAHASYVFIDLWSICRESIITFQDTHRAVMKSCFTETAMCMSHPQCICLLEK